MIHKTFRLFISSTFSDFLCERTLLNDKVFPIIDEFCQGKGYKFQLVDLRWGINSESALNQKTISICLDEVERCTTLSPRPNFLIMAGERYGWIPLPYTFHINDFNNLCRNATESEKLLLQEWYIYDGNEIGGCYYLKERTGEYIEDAVWFEKEKELHLTIVKLLETIDDKSGEYDTYKVSATEHEIFTGLFDKLEQSKNVIALFRTGFPDKDESQEKIISLKQRIEARLCSAGCQENIINLCWDEQYQQIFVERIIDILKKNIAEEIKHLDDIEENDDLLTDEFKKNNRLLNIDKSKIEAIHCYVNGKEKEPLFVVGESGSGKTTILSEFVCQCQKPVFYSFFGIGENSFTLQAAISEIYRKIKKDINININFNLTKNNITEVLHDLIYSVPTKEDIVIIIDGFDNFYDLNEVHETILPEKLPENVKFIVSIADNEVLNRFYVNHSPKLVIDKFDSKEAYATIELLLSHKNRCITTSKQIQSIKEAVSSGATPLQVKLLSELSAGWRSQEDIVTLPCTVQEIAYLYLTEMYEKYGHNKELFAYTMALIAVAPFGITEDEILELLFRFAPVKNYFLLEDRYNHNLLKLPFAVWSRLFYDLKGCLTLVRLHGDIVVKFVHQIFYQVILDRFTNYCSQALQVLKEFYYNQGNYINKECVPNKRKALCLPILLRKCNDLGTLAELMGDLEFVDATIKVGRVDNSIYDIIYLIENNKSQETHLRILSCLQNNKDMLNCYKGEFLSCIDFTEITDKHFFIHCSQNNIQTKYRFFPYSKNSKLSWFGNNDLMAVYHKNYVYIYSNKQSKELCRIYVVQKQDEQMNISNVLWIDNCTIVVITSSNEFIVYDFEDRIPNEIGRRNFDQNCVRYDEKMQMLLFIKGSRIYSINPFSLKEYYYIDLGKLSKYTSVEFDVDSDNEEIIFRKKGGLISTYSLHNGKKKREIRFKATIKSKYSAWAEKKVLQVSQNDWFMYVLSDKEFAVYSYEEDNAKFLLPPIALTNVKMLLGRKTVILYNEQIMYWIDLQSPFNIYFSLLENINDFSWKTIDEELSILDSNGLFFEGKCDFNQFEDNQYCLTSKKALFNTLMFSAINTSTIIIEFIKTVVPRKGNYLGYKTIFDAFSFFEDSENGVRKLDKYPTIIEYANNGFKAVAFEDKDEIILYDNKDEIVLSIGKLNLALNDNILKMEFSKDSKYFLLWRNHSIQLIDIEHLKCLLNLNVARRPVFDVAFIDSEVKILFCNEDEHIFSPNHVRKSQFPKKLTQTVDEDKFVGPYKTYDALTGKRKLLSMMAVEHLNFFKFPSEWLSDERVYTAEDIVLLLQGGEFYLSGDKSLKFDKGFCDFKKSIEIERFKDGTPKKSYLREKNDLFSKLYKISDDILVLVSRMMNSVITFNIKEMRIIGAYKHSSNIIGCRICENNVLEINCDCYPYVFSLEIKC